MRSVWTGWANRACLSCIVLVSEVTRSRLKHTFEKLNYGNEPMGRRKFKVHNLWHYISDVHLFQNAKHATEDVVLISI